MKRISSGLGPLVAAAFLNIVTPTPTEAYIDGSSRSYLPEYREALKELQEENERKLLIEGGLGLGMLLTGAGIAAFSYRKRTGESIFK